MELKILVLLKQTFDTEEKINIVEGVIQEDGANFIINPYDEYAIEEAVRLKEDYGGEVTVISIGPSRTREALRTALAMGVDKAILVENEHTALDEYAVTTIMESIISEKDYNIIFAGNMAIDSASTQVGPRLAQALNIPNVSAALNFKLEGDKAIIDRDVEGNVEVIESFLPVLVTAQQGLNEPRYPSLPSIMKAKRKPIETLTLEDLQIKDQVVSHTEFLMVFPPPKKEPGRILKGELRDQVNELVNILHDQLKIV